MRFTHRACLFFLALAAQMHATAFAADLSVSDRKALSEAVHRFNTAFLNFDAQGTADETFVPFMDRFGGKANYAALLQQGYQSAASAPGRKIISQRTELPKNTVETASYALCIVGDVTVWEYQGRKFRTNGFSLAVKNNSTGEWKLIGGNAIRQDSTLLDELFPHLPKDFPTPTYETVELP
jgi:hypothetical protein